MKRHQTSKLEGTALLLALLFLVPIASCGGGAGGPGPDGDGQGLVLTHFSEAGNDQVALNRTLFFQFSEPVDPASINSATIQVKEGPSFGHQVAGEFSVHGAEVRFRPRLPCRPDLSDGGLHPETTYRIVVSGHPEAFAVCNTGGQALASTASFYFTTADIGSLTLFEDPNPGAPPEIVSVAPAAGVSFRPGIDASPAAVPVASGCVLRIHLSENVDPRTVTSDVFRLRMTETGETGVNPQVTPGAFQEAPGGRLTGFDSVVDLAPSVHESWGASNSTFVVPSLTIPLEARVEQDFKGTQLTVRPMIDIYPDNALLVVDVLSGITDLGRAALPSTTFSFTTENLVSVGGEQTLEFDGDVPFDATRTTADVNTDRSPGLIQGFLRIGGDGNNGTSLTDPAGPLPCIGQANDPDGPTHFDTADFGGLVTLNTGSPIACANDSDGSTAAVFEYQSFRVRSGHRVRFTGLNPAIILVRGDVLVEDGGMVTVRGSDGANSFAQGSSAPALSGGRGVVGGGDGGRSRSSNEVLAGAERSLDGFAGYGSPDHDPYMVTNGVGQGGAGAGEGGSSSKPVTCNKDSGAQGGGGGGHGRLGEDAGLFQPTNSTWYVSGAGRGGATYPSGSAGDLLYWPSAGSGGGGGGSETEPGDHSSGGGGGAGGGFVCFCSDGDITVYGSIDASGGAGGRGGWDPDGSCNGSNSSGGGGGSGGGIRLLSAGDIVVTGGTLVAAGGAPGAPGTPAGPLAGGGASGRLVLEDSDGVIAGSQNATLVPAEGTQGYHNSSLDGQRFVSGGLTPVAVTEPFLVPAWRPVFDRPEAADFVALLPTAAQGDLGRVVMKLEVQGFPMSANGTVNSAAGSGWVDLGHFEDAGSEAPRWVAASIGLEMLDGLSYVQLRVTLYLKPGTEIADPGPALDRWKLSFSSNL